MTEDKRVEFELMVVPPEHFETDDGMDSMIAVVVTIGAAILTVLIILIWALNMLAIPIA